MSGIEGKVAKIINVYTVVINRGREHGVEDGMRFIIYDQGEDITDPDSGESLGRFENVLMKVKVVNVNEKISTATSDETFDITTNPSILSSFSYLQPSTRTEFKRLPLDKETMDGLTKSKKEVIKIGDLVRQILD